MAKAATKTAAPVAAPTPPPPTAPRQQGVNGVYFDRDGNPISRKGVAQNGAGWNPEAPNGWDYQWIRVYVRGNPEFNEYHEMYDAGWRAVPHGRHPQLFTSVDDEKLGLTGCIIKNGQLLVERPLGMSLDAKEEARRVATGALVNRLRSHGMGIPEGVRGMDVSRADVRRGTFAGPGVGKDGSHDPRDSFTYSETPKYDLAIDE